MAHTMMLTINLKRITAVKIIVVGEDAMPHSVDLIKRQTDYFQWINPGEYEEIGRIPMQFPLGTQVDDCVIKMDWASGDMLICFDVVSDQYVINKQILLHTLEVLIWYMGRVVSYHITTKGGT